MLDLQNLTGGMHITLNGAHAWPPILSELKESPNSEDVTYLFKDYGPELAAYPVGLEKSVCIDLYNKAVTQLAKRISLAESQIDMDIIRGISKNWIDHKINNYEFLEICFEEIKVYSNIKKLFLLDMIEITLINNVYLNKLNTDILKGLQHYINKLDLKIENKIQFFFKVQQVFDSQDPKCNRLFTTGISHFTVNFNDLCHKLNLTDHTDIVNYLLFNNEPTSTFRKALMFTSDPIKIAEFLQNSELPILTEDYPSL